MRIDREKIGAAERANDFQDRRFLGKRHARRSRESYSDASGKVRHICRKRRVLQGAETLRVRRQKNKRPLAHKPRVFAAG
jgi:hypothetical protein